MNNKEKSMNIKRDNNEIDIIRHKIYKKKRLIERLEGQIYQEEDNIKYLEKQLRDKCKHESITKSIYSDYDNTEYIYYCDYCKLKLNSHTEVKYEYVLKEEYIN